MGLENRRHSTRWPIFIASVLVGLISLVGVTLYLGQYSATAPPTPIGRPTPSLTGIPSGGPGSPFDKVDAALGGYIDSAVKWQSPSQGLTVDETVDLGVSIGDAPGLQAALDQNLPGSTSIPAGSVRVGPDTDVTLEGAEADVQIEPKAPIRASTGSQIGLLFIWKVHPLHATEDLSLTAVISVPVVDQDGRAHTVTTPVTHRFQVAPTLAYRARQVATAWQTWFGIAATVGGGFVWLWRHRRALALDTKPPPKTVKNKKRSR